MNLNRPRLLDYFDDNHKGAALNIIFELLRKGLPKGEMLQYLKLDFQMRLDKNWGLNETEGQFSSLINRLDFSEIFNEAVDYCIEWDKKPREEKEKIKKERNKTYMEGAMADKEPTEKQIELLRKKGYPIPKTRLEASKLIGKIINGS